WWCPARAGSGRASIAQVGEDQAEVLLRGVALDPHLAGEAGILGGLLDTLARPVVLPAVVEAADAVALHPARAELRAPVRAGKVDQVGLWTRRYWSVQPLSPVEREVLAHDADRFRVARREIRRDVHRLPEPAHVATGQRAGARVREVKVFHGVGFAPGLD